jgi:hypothetical protein
MGGTPTRTRSLKKIITLLLLLIGSAAVSAAFTSWPRSILRFSPSSQGLIVSEKYLHFGEVLEDDDFRWSLLIENPTQDTVEIERFTSSCDCLAVMPEALTIAPGEKAKVQLTINLTVGAPRPEDDPAYKDVEVQIVPQISKPDWPVQRAWGIRGRVRRIVSLSPDRLNFETSPEGKPLPSKIVIATAHIPLERMDVSCSPVLGSVQVTRPEANSNVFRLAITPHSDLPPGHFRFLVRLQPVSTSLSRKLPSVKVPVEGVVLGEYRTLPESLLLGPRFVGESVTESVVICSASNKPFDVQGVNVSSDDTRAVAERQGDLGARYRITQQISKPGKQEPSVVFTILTEDKDTVKVPLYINYVGLSPQGQGG